MKKTELDIEELLARYNEGETYRELATAYGVSRRMIGYRLEPLTKVEHRGGKKDQENAEIYGYIKERRDGGATLQEIGDEIGRSRERVRQILVKQYGTADISKALLTTNQLAGLTNCSEPLIYKFRQQGIISPVGHGRWRPETVDIILEHRKCKMCGKPLPAHRFVYCSDTCQIEGGKYKNRSEVAKKLHNERIRHWQREHPERYREIQSKALRRYHLKHYVYLHQRFSLLIPVNLDNILETLGKEETMYPFQATLIKKETIPRGALPPGQYNFLAELKNQLQSGQAIQLVAPDNRLVSNITSAWRRIGQGEQPHTRAKKQQDGSYLVYLWLGELS